MTTAIYIALMSVVGLVLSVWVVRYRISNRIVIGDGEDSQMRRRVRAFGNFTEYAPWIMGILIACEMSGASQFWLHLLGICAVLGRIFHGLCFLDHKSIGTHFLLRRAGMVLTYGVIMVGVVLLFFARL